MTNESNEIPVLSNCMSRRQLLFRGAAAVTGTVLLSSFPGSNGEALAARVTTYPRLAIGKLSKLNVNEPGWFVYPDKSAANILIKLGEPAGGGIGPDQDIVAFSQICPHMGGPLGGTYKPNDQALGPCPLHQTSFDLTRHGMVIAGHATESLPQIVLELDGDDIYATGILGLLYGRCDNLKS